MTRYIVTLEIAGHWLSDTYTSISDAYECVTDFIDEGCGEAVDRDVLMTALVAMKRGETRCWSQADWRISAREEPDT